MRIDAEAMAASSLHTELAPLADSHAEDDEASISELTLRALGGARDLATHEATLALVELEHDMLVIRTALGLAALGAMCVSVSVGWAGVALALALSPGPLALAIAAGITIAIGAVLLWMARRHLPSAVLGKTRARLERRVVRVAESLR